MLEAHSDRIDLWLAFADKITSPALLSRYRRILSENEKRQELRFHFSKDRHRYLITRALVRTVLSQYAPISPEQWEFASNAYGKPAISNNHWDAKTISFNISHTDGLVALGITKAKSIGVDAENIISRPAPIEVANHFFSANEVAELDALTLSKRQERFFQFWTLKEAYIKARGMGLSIPLNQFSFHIPAPAKSSTPRLSFHPDLNDDPYRWRFWQFRASSNHLLAICVERAEVAAAHLQIHRIIPLVESEKMHSLPIFDFVHP